ncbi:hypothetical protein EBZ37_14115, partial [bacterium]|nr:hypothetical protein [bacterium]
APSEEVAEARGWVICPLHGELSREEQDLAVEPLPKGSKKRKIMELDDQAVLDFDDFTTSTMTVSKFANLALLRTSLAEVLGVFGAIAAIEVSVSSRLASDLTSGHMRIVAAVSKLRKFVYTKQVSEPVLALAAHSLITDEHIPWNLILQRYISAQQNHSTMTGFMAELAFQVLMLMAWQQCLANLRVGAFDIPFIPAFVFLEVLFGAKLKRVSQQTAAVLEALREHLQGGWVRVNQVVLTNSQLSVDMLCDYAVRASAIACAAGQTAIDQLIPVVYSELPSVPPSLESLAFSSNESLSSNLLDPPSDSDVQFELNKAQFFSVTTGAGTSKFSAKNDPSDNRRKEQSHLGIRGEVSGSDCVLQAGRMSAIYIQVKDKTKF